MDILTARLTRRRTLALAAAMAPAAAMVGRTPRTAAQATPAPGIATPAGTPIPPIATNPMPATLAADASPAFRAVADALVAAMHEHGVPGAAVGVLWGDREEHATFGLESLSSLRPVTDQTLFQTGSLTKTFTASVIWHLIDQGALSLDAPVRTWLPDLTLQDSEVAERLTIGNLLDHSAGFYGDDTFDTGDNEDALARYVAERLPLLPQEFPLGAYFSYNNICFTTLGRLIEVTTGASYRAAMGNLLFAPLGLSNTMLERSDVLQHPYADGHVTMPINDKVVTTVQIPLWIVRSADPAGAIWSTTRDLIRYGRFHIARGTITSPANIVSPESLAQMQEPVLPITGTSLWMGRDWFVQDIDGIRAISHGGDTLGQHADFFAVPEYDFAIAVLTNGQPGSAVALAAVDAAVSQIPALAALAGKLGLDPALHTPADAQPLQVTADELGEYAGQYANPDTSLTVTVKDAALEFAATPTPSPGSWQPVLMPPAAQPAALALVAPDVAGIPGGPKIPFQRDADGRVGWVASGLRLIPRVDES
jgi:CubicO group peptidase (beta-lactamase class C family)